MAGSFSVVLRGVFMGEPFRVKSGKGYLRRFLSRDSAGRPAVVSVMADNDHLDALRSEGDVFLTLAFSDFGFLREVRCSEDNPVSFSSAYAVNE